MRPILKSTIIILIFTSLCSLPIFLPAWAATTVQIAAVAIVYDLLRKKWIEKEKN